MALTASIGRADYQKAAESWPNLPIYFEPWWLDSTTFDGEWHGMVISENDTPVALWPFVLKTRLRFNLVTLPPLTQFLGPLFRYPPDQRHARKLSFETSVVR